MEIVKSRKKNKNKNKNKEIIHARIISVSKEIH